MPTSADETAEDITVEAADDESDDEEALLALELLTSGFTGVEHPAIKMKVKQTIIIFAINLFACIGIAIFLLYIFHATKSIILIKHPFHPVNYNIIWMVCIDGGAGVTFK